MTASTPGSQGPNASPCEVCGVRVAWPLMEGHLTNHRARTAASTPGDGELDLDEAERDIWKWSLTRTRAFARALVVEVRKLRHDEVEWERLHDQLDQLRAELASRPVPRVVIATREELDARPEVVTLCGSTRFYDEFRRQNLRLTLQGRIVLSIGCDTKSDDDLIAAGELGVDVSKAGLDELHKRKIDLSDRVLVLNVGGYIGESTRSEIAYAAARGVPVDYLWRQPSPGDGS